MYLLLIATFIVATLGKGVKNINGAACLFVASNFTAFPFDCPMPDLAYKCRCQDPSFLGTVMNCIDDYATDARDLSLGVIQLIDTCKAQGGIEWEFIALTDVYTNATSYLVEFEEAPELKYKARWVMQAQEAQQKLEHGMMKDGKIVGVDKAVEEIGIERIANATETVLRYPVAVPQNLYDRSYNSVVNLVSQRQLATRYGLYLYLYWGVVMLVASISNMIQWCSPQINNRISSNKISLWIKRRILCPQVIRPRQVIKCTSTEYRSKFLRKWHENFTTAIYTMPLRVHALVLMGYVALMVVFCCVNYEIVTPNTVFTCPRGQIYVAIADRTGIIGTIQLPLIFLFFTRNNVLSNATGLSYRTFQVFHRWIARVTFMLLVLHCCFYLMFVHVRGDYINRWGLLKWRCANASFAAIVITVGITFFRRFGYEFFKMTHKMCLVVFAIGAWYHCVTLGWTEYLIVSYVIWGLEYLMRFGKIIATGGLLTGSCTLLNDPDGYPHSIRLVVNHSGWWKPFPGCCCWIYVMKGNMFWQAHPFTVVSVSNTENYNRLVFSIRVKDGATQALANHVAKGGDRSEIRVLVEGPYGNNVPFKQYEETVLVAGGVGMAVIYSVAMDLANINRARRARGAIDDGSKVSVIWVVPNLESMFAFRNEMDHLKEYGDILQVEVFVTRKLRGWDLQDIVEASGALPEEDSEMSSEEGTGDYHLASGSTVEIITQGGMGSLEVMNKEKGIIDTSGNNSVRNCDRPSACSPGNAGDSGEENEFETSREQTSTKLSSDSHRTHEIAMREFLRSIICASQRAGSFHVNFQDKPSLTEEMHAYLNTIQTSPTALISCGPTQMNAEVRVAVARCLKDGKCVDYFEEELLW